MKKDFVVKVVSAIYERLRKSKLSIFLFPVQTRKDLKALNREEEAYYTQKLTQILGAVMALFMVVCFGMGSIYMAQQSTVDVIKRPKVYEESRETTVQIVGGDTYTFEISPRIFTLEEAHEAFDTFLTELENYILGGNQDAMAITENLLLTDTITGYPFTIYWETDKEQVIDSIGNVYREALEEDEIVTLFAVCTYMEYQWEAEFSVQVLKEKLSEEEQRKRKLEAYLLEEEQNSRFSEIWHLPETYDGEIVQYKEVVEWDKLALLGGLVCVAGIALWIGSDKDLHKERRKRQDILEEEYLNFVSALSLYISSGLNMQMAMKYCVKDYGSKKPSGDILREALLRFEKDISSGYSFQTSLEMFADRTDHIYYKRLTGLLQQGLFNGASDLAGTLRQEVEKIREDKRRQCKIKGEKMSSALIAPMLLQLCIVMVFIMLPAFSNMQF